MGDFNQIDGNYEVHLPSGKILKFKRHIKNRIKAAYEDWLEGMARAKVMRSKPYLTQEEYVESLKATSIESAAGTFAWGGKAWEKSLSQLAGALRLMCLLAEDAGNPMNEEQLLGYVKESGVGEDDPNHPMNVLEEIIQGNPVNFICPPDRAQMDR